MIDLLQIPGARFGVFDLVMIVLNILFLVGIVGVAVYLVRRFTGGDGQRAEELERRVNGLERRIEELESKVEE